MVVPQNGIRSYIYQDQHTFNCPSLNLNTSPFCAVKKRLPSNSNGDERWLENSQILSDGRVIFRFYNLYNFLFIITDRGASGK